MQVHRGLDRGPGVYHPGHQARLVQRQDTGGPWPGALLLKLQRQANGRWLRLRGQVSAVYRPQASRRLLPQVALLQKALRLFHLWLHLLHLRLHLLHPSHLLHLRQLQYKPEPTSSKLDKETMQQRGSRQKATGTFKTVKQPKSLPYLRLNPGKRWHRNAMIFERQPLQRGGPRGLRRRRCGRGCRRGLGP